MVAAPRTPEPRPARAQRRSVVRAGSTAVAVTSERTGLVVVTVRVMAVVPSGVGFPMTQNLQGPLSRRPGTTGQGLRPPSRPAVDSHTLLSGLPATLDVDRPFAWPTCPLWAKVPTFTR